jgi:hypothetical protein
MTLINLRRTKDFSIKFPRHVLEEIEEKYNIFDMQLAVV